MKISKTVNNTICAIPEEITDSLIIKLLNKAAKGYRQMDIAYMLITTGHIYNDDMFDYDMTAFENYITRVQKLFMKFCPNWHIFYGQLNNDKDYGYYLYKYMEE